MSEPRPAAAVDSNLHSHLPKVEEPHMAIATERPTSISVEIGGRDITFEYQLVQSTGGEVTSVVVLADNPVVLWCK